MRLIKTFDHYDKDGLCNACGKKTKGKHMNKLLITYKYKGYGLTDIVKMCDSCKNENFGSS